MPKQRARREEDKLERREVLLDAARALLATHGYDAHGYDSVKMADVAARAELAKGTVFFYFATKEALFLSLLERELFAWFSDLDERLGEGGRYSGERVARMIASTLAVRPLLTLLLSLLASVLEQNVGVERIVEFKLKLLVRLRQSGVLIERRLPFLGVDEGPRTLLRIYAVVVGLRQLTDPGADVKKALERPELRPLVLDFETELTPLLSALFEGLARAHAARTGK